MANGSSTYIRHLPGIFREPRPDGSEPFLGDFLRIFEALLAGRADAAERRVRGIEETVERFPDYIDPALTPIDEPLPPPGSLLHSEFLDYLGSWIALAIDQNWDLGKRREWARRIVALYRRRGTRDGLQEYLATFVGNQVRVDEPDGGITLAVDNTTLGVDTFIADAPAYFFRVRLDYGFPPEPFDFGVWNNLIAGTRAIVDLEKPAHTYYRLEAYTAGIIINERSTINVDTLIWDNSVI
jgi:phage tail-like protein